MAVVLLVYPYARLPNRIIGCILIAWIYSNLMERVLNRLWRLVTMSMEQQRTVEALWIADGICSCGRPIGRMDHKLCLAQVNSSWCVLEGVRNTLAIGIYCAVCADKINICLKSLKRLPERDKLKSRVISGA